MLFGGRRVFVIFCFKEKNAVIIFLPPPKKIALLTIVRTCARSRHNNIYNNSLCCYSCMKAGRSRSYKLVATSALENLFPGLWTWTLHWVSCKASSSIQCVSVDSASLIIYPEIKATEVSFQSWKCYLL